MHSSEIAEGYLLPAHKQIAPFSKVLTTHNALFQDVVERFHLMITALFIMVEDMGQNSTRLPRKETITSCAMIIISESLVDVIKHAVLGKFSDIRPGIYREYLRDLFQKVTVNFSHNMHKFLTMEPLGPGILFIRIIASALFAWVDDSSGARFKFNNHIISVGYIIVVAFAIKLLLGFWIRKVGVWYVIYFEKHHGRPRTPRKETLKKNS